LSLLWAACEFPGYLFWNTWIWSIMKCRLYQYNANDHLRPLFNKSRHNL
jgi:hypothetical protein